MALAVESREDAVAEVAIERSMKVDTPTASHVGSLDREHSGVDVVGHPLPPVRG
jgi:hypothetical protein